MSKNYPNTNDQRRINNSNAKTLLQNWVEEVLTFYLSSMKFIFKENKEKTI